MSETLEKFFVLIFFFVENRVLIAEELFYFILKLS